MAASVRQQAHKRGVISLLSPPRTLLVVALGGLVVFYLIMRLLSGGSKVTGQFELDVKNGKISINTHGEQADFIEVINQLFADDKKSSITSPYLASALEKLAPDHPVSRALRALVKRTKGPFGNIQRHVRIDAAADPTLTGIIAASCTDSEFQDEALLLQSARRGLFTLNVSSQPFLCPHPPDEPLVRVSLETYRELFGSVPQHEQTVVVSVYPFQPVVFVPSHGEHTP